MSQNEQEYSKWAKEVLEYQGVENRYRQIDAHERHIRAIEPQRKLEIGLAIVARATAQGAGNMADILCDYLTPAECEFLATMCDVENQTLDQFADKFTELLLAGGHIRPPDCES